MMKLPVRKNQLQVEAKVFLLKLHCPRLFFYFYKITDKCYLYLTEEDAKASMNQQNLELPILNDSLKRSETTSTLTLFPAENIYETAAKLLFLSIKWARTIPSFLQLSYRDQSILLEGSWSELFILTAAQWSLPVDETFLVANAIAPSSRSPILEDDARKLRDVISRLTLLRVDHTEHACLKALVLFKAGN